MKIKTDFTSVTDLFTFNADTPQEALRKAARYIEENSRLITDDAPHFTLTNSGRRPS